MEKNKFKKLELLFVFIYTLIIYSLTYIFIKTDSLKMNFIIIDNVIKDGIQYIIVGYIILLLFFILLKSIIGDNFRTNIVATIIILLITTISYYKMSILGEPFIPTDILLVKNINQIAKFGVTFPPLNLILIILILISILLLQYILRKKYYIKEKIQIKKELYRIPLFIVSTFLLYVLCISPSRFEQFHMKNVLNDGYYWMGGNAIFFLHLGDSYAIKPKEYTEENIRNIQEEYITNKNQIENDVKPNIIMVMNESFSNPNNIKNVNYSVNPVENIENLYKNDPNCIMGNIVAPVFGGNTAVTEFEALTGLTSYFLEKQIYPHTSYIRKNMNSIVREYRNNDYTTIGIHTNTQTFYNRKSVYKYLGFEKTIFSENIDNPEIKGGNISDNEFANQVIKEFENNTGNKYIFGITMQNHMPYTDKTYEKYDVEIESEILTDDEKLKLKNYIQGVYDGDQMYIKLVNYLRNVEEPTILVMFGDHLPALKSIYDKENYDGLDYYTTPYIIWTNYDLRYENVNLSKYLSPSNLSLNIMRLSNIEIPWYFKKYEELYRIYPAINNQLVLTSEGKILNKEYVSNNDLVNDCRILQYDLLIKKKYILVE